MSIEPKDLHLTGLVSEHGYQGESHWLMFLFEVKQKLKALPSPHREGTFQFFPQAALAALTTQPAAMLGESARLGTVEAGRAAQLVVTRGDPFVDEDAAIGRLYLPREALSAAGKPVRKPAAILAAPIPMNSWLASTFWPCFAAKTREVRISSA